MNVTETGSSVLMVDNRCETNIYLTDVLNGLLHDLSIDGPLAKYLSRRTRNEGIKFLCQILPRVSAAILQAIEYGGYKYLITHPVNCYVRLHSRRSPFRVLICDLFGADGIPNINGTGAYALRCILQLCDYFKKLELPNGTTINYEAALGFVRKNKQLGSLSPMSSTEVALARHITNRVFPFSYMSQHEFYHDYNCGDGPGTYSRELPERTSEGVIPCASLKRGLRNNVFDVKQRQYKKAIMRTYPEGVRFERIERNYSELLLVPKTASSARVIVREPKHNLRLQKAFFNHHSVYLRKVTNGRLNLYSQTYNQERAHEASLTREYATIDVRNGSNSVPYEDIRTIERFNAPVMNLLDNCRTTHVFIPIFWESDDDRDCNLVGANLHPNFHNSTVKGIASTYLDRVFCIDEMVEAGCLKLTNMSGGHTSYLYTGDNVWTASVLKYEHGIQSHHDIALCESRYRHICKARSLHNSLVSELDTLLGINKRVVYNNRLGYVVKLHMLAGMGSYLTFCFMMRYFLVLLVMSAVKEKFGFQIIHRKSKRKELNTFIDHVSENCSIYGDDIRCPSWLVPSFSNYAASRGVELNMDKSFVNSHFRESCGPFYYNGTDVTPLRCSLPVQDGGNVMTIKHGECTLMALSAHARLLKENGFNHLARVYRAALYRAIGKENATGILEPGLASGKAGYIYSPNKGQYHGLSDDDRYNIYWSTDHYEITTYGAALIDQVAASTGFLDIRLLGERAKGIPALYQYRPMDLPSIPRKGTFVIKNDSYAILAPDNYEVIEELDGDVMWLYAILCITAMLCLVASVLYSVVI